jgi:hypothetical protein
MRGGVDPKDSGRRPEVDLVDGRFYASDDMHLALRLEPASANRRYWEISGLLFAVVCDDRWVGQCPGSWGQRRAGGAL